MEIRFDEIQADVCSRRELITRKVHRGTFIQFEVEQIHLGTAAVEGHDDVLQARDRLQ